MTAVLSCPANALATDHVFTPLRPGWRPDAATPCDCGAVSWDEYQRALARRFAEQTRELLDLQLRAELERPAKLNPPGPNPDFCAAPGPHGRTCGGRMGTPVRGRRTGLWIRQCGQCGAHTHSTDAPNGVVKHPPRAIGTPLPGEMFSGIETIHRPTKSSARMEPVAVQAGLFDRKRRRG